MIKDCACYWQFITILMLEILKGRVFHLSTKQITTGEGGVVVSNDEEFIKKVQTLKAFGIDVPPNLRKNLDFMM